jgi:hypothetical protein
MSLTTPISWQRHLLNGLAICVSLLWIQPPTLADSLLDNSIPTEINQLSSPQKLTIPPLSPSEISPNSRSESVAEKQNFLTAPSFNAVIKRELPKLWRMRVPLDQVNSLYATYELKAKDGEENEFKHEKRPDSSVKVVIEPLPINIISEDTTTNTALIEGGVNLTIDLSQASSAGQYIGDLIVTVNQKQ